MDHPENDLTSEADQSNRFRPHPTSAEELAEAPDPLAVARANRRSTRQAIMWAVGTPILTAIVGVLVAAVFRASGGPLCTAGTATWLCTRTAEIWWPIITSIVPVASMLGCGAIMYRKYLRYTRWRPWMGTFWFLVPFSMMWMVTVFQLAIVGH